MKKIVLFFLALILMLNFYHPLARAEEQKTAILKEISVTPVCIINSKSNNFLYENNGEECLKVLEFSIENNDKIINLINEEKYLIKNRNYFFKIPNFNFAIQEGFLKENISIKMVNNFKFGNFQYEVKVSNEPNILRVNKRLTEEKNFQIEFNNINLSSGGASLKITLYFEVL